jgi:hypothetical protein
MKRFVLHAVMTALGLGLTAAAVAAQPPVSKGTHPGWNPYRAEQRQDRRIERRQDRRQEERRDMRQERRQDRRQEQRQDNRQQQRQLYPLGAGSPAGGR